MPQRWVRCSQRAFFLMMVISGAAQGRVWSLAEGGLKVPGLGFVPALRAGVLSPPRDGASSFSKALPAARTGGQAAPCPLLCDPGESLSHSEWLSAPVKYRIVTLIR